MKGYRTRRFANPRSGGFIGIEYKFLDCAWNQVTINSSTDGSSGELQPSSGCTDCISMPSQGDGESQRDGRTFVIKEVWVSGVIDENAKSDQADVGEGFGMFFALVLDTQANGATIVSENVYTNPTAHAQAMLPQPLRNLQFSKRFKILDSRYVRNGGMYSAADNAGTTNFTASTIMQNSPKISLNWKGNIKVETQGTTADIANATDNAIHVIAYNGSSQVRSFIGKSRMRFVG